MLQTGVDEHCHGMHLPRHYSQLYLGSYPSPMQFEPAAYR